MRKIQPFVVVPEIDGKTVLKNIERAGRTCYKSEGSISDESYKQFIGKLIRLEHLSQLEHESISVRIICDRGVSHELVRHRLASYSQESTRYCNYNEDKFNNELTFIEPFYFLEGGRRDEYICWQDTCQRAEENYLGLIKVGATPQEARAILPNSLKTEIVMTANLREWRHFFNLRAHRGAHPQMQQIAIPLLLYMREQIEVVFDNISYNRDFNEEYYSKIVTEKEWQNIGI